MRRRKGENDEELEGEADDLVPGAGGDLGSILLGVQEGAGNHALASMIAQVETGEEPATALLPGRRENGDGGQADLAQRLAAARANPFAKRLESELEAFTRRLTDASASDFQGTDATVLDSELAEIEDKLGRAEREEQAAATLAAVDRHRAPLSERTKKAILERTALTKPGLMIYAPEDFEALMELHKQLIELEKELIDNNIAVTTVGGSLGGLSDVTTEYVRTAATKLRDDLDKAAVTLGDYELVLKEVSSRHASANAEDREKLNQLMAGLEPRLQREPTMALNEGASRQEIDYLLKTAWLEQHEATQKLSKDEMWQLVTGFSSEEGTTSYFDLPGRMDRWRMHMAVEFGVMQDVDVGCSDSDIRDALFGGQAAVDKRAHVTAEVLGREDARNPSFYYGTSRISPPKGFWGTNEGKVVKRNWSSNQSKMIDAFNDKAVDLVKTVHDVLEDRKSLKAIVVKVGESLKWAN